MVLNLKVALGMTSESLEQFCITPRMSIFLNISQLTLAIKLVKNVNIYGQLRSLWWPMEWLSSDRTPLKKTARLML